jgi:MFS transporter, CP family, cyanate transporter
MVLKTHRSSSGVLLAAIVLAGLNLRVVFASLPPLLHHVRDDLGLSAGVAGLLTTGPVLCFGLFAPLAPRLAQRVSIERLLVAAALLTAAGTGVRGIGGVAPLFAGTILAGIAIAVAQVLVPILVRSRFPERSGVLMGGFSLALTLGSAIAAGLAVPLEDLFGSWRGSLAIFALPAALAAAVWLAPAAELRTVIPAGPSLGLHRLPGSWSMAVFFGLQSMAFYSGLTWFPTILEAHGFSDAAAGGLQAFGNVVQLGPAFLVPILAGRRKSQTGILFTLIALSLAGLGGLLAAPGAAIAWMALIGLAQGGALGLALILPVLRGRTAPGVAALTAMSLCVGYLLASVGPFVLGVAHDSTGHWTLPLLLLMAITVAEAVGIPATRIWQDSAHAPRNPAVAPGVVRADRHDYKPRAQVEGTLTGEVGLQVPTDPPTDAHGV